MFAPVKGDLDVSMIDQYIKKLIIEQIEKSKDADLLDLIYKLLIAEGQQ